MLSQHCWPPIAYAGLAKQRNWQRWEGEGGAQLQPAALCQSWQIFSFKLELVGIYARCFWSLSREIQKSSWNPSLLGTDGISCGDCTCAPQLLFQTTDMWQSLKLIEQEINFLLLSAQNTINSDTFLLRIISLDNDSVFQISKSSIHENRFSPAVFPIQVFS